MSTIAERRPARPEARPAPPVAWSAADQRLVQRSVVVSCLVGSALIHGSVAGEHLEKWVPAGVFFVILQLVEVGLALVTVFVWDRLVAGAVALSGMGTVAVWLVSRTVGMPVGPSDFRTHEPLGTADLTCCILELASVGAALFLLREPAPDEPGRARQNNGAQESAPSSASRAARCLAVVVAVGALVLTVWGLGSVVLSPSGGHGHGGYHAVPDHVG